MEVVTGVGMTGVAGMTAAEMTAGAEMIEAMVVGPEGAMEEASSECFVFITLTRSLLVVFIILVSKTKSGYST